MRSNFDIGGICYTVEYAEKLSEFRFFVDETRSTRRTVRPPPTTWDFYEDPPSKNWRVTGAAGKDAIRVLRRVARFVEGVVSARRPFFFRFSANEDAKLPLYERFARRLAAKLGYELQLDGRCFRFRCSPTANPNLTAPASGSRRLAALAPPDQGGGSQDEDLTRHLSGRGTST